MLADIHERAVTAYVVSTSASPPLVLVLKVLFFKKS